MIDKETQRIAWSCLPKEFKEEVKERFTMFVNEKNPSDCSYGYIGLLIKLFGVHNLTSDAEGEEMLTVSRKQIDALQGEIFKAIMDAHDADDWQDAAHYILDIMPRSFAALFGTKCLTDEEEKSDNDFNVPEPNCKHFKDGKCAHPAVRHIENGKLVKGADCDVSSCEDVEYEPKPAEPKFTKGDMVHCKSFGYEGDYKVLEYKGGPRNCYDCIDKYGAYYGFYESDLEPYIDPTENFCRINGQEKEDKGIETAISSESTLFSIESNRVDILNYALLKLEEASKEVREALTKINR